MRSYQEQRNQKKKKPRMEQIIGGKILGESLLCLDSSDGESVQCSGNFLSLGLDSDGPTSRTHNDSTRRSLHPWPGVEQSIRQGPSAKELKVKVFTLLLGPCHHYRPCHR